MISYKGVDGIHLLGWSSSSRYTCQKWIFFNYTFPAPRIPALGIEDSPLEYIYAATHTHAQALYTPFSIINMSKSQKETRFTANKEKRIYTLRIEKMGAVEPMGGKEVDKIDRQGCVFFVRGREGEKESDNSERAKESCCHSKSTYDSGTRPVSFCTSATSQP